MTDDTAVPPRATPPAPRRFAKWLDVRFRSPAAIYGTIVFAAFLAIGVDHAEDPGDLLDNALLSLVVFYLAHVFAHTLTDHGEHGFLRALWHAMQHAAGMLYAAVPSTLILLLADDDVEGAYDATVWATIIVLAVLGYVAYSRRGAHVVVRILGAVGTALLGFLLVILEYAVH